MKTKFGVIGLSLLLLAISFTIISAQEATPEPTVDHAAHHPTQTEATPDAMPPMDGMGNGSASGQMDMMKPMKDMMDNMMGMDMPADMRDKMNQMRGMMDMMSMMHDGGEMGDMMQPMMDMMDSMMGMDMPADMRDKMNQMRGMMDMMSMMDMMHGGGEMGMMQGEATPEPTPDAMDGMAMEMNTGYSVDDLAPLAFAYFEGGDVYFVHPEASEENVAGVLTAMMGTDVITVPSLGQIPAELLGKVYVFTNGLDGMGPLGFQPDVFNSVPGSENYTPLRAIQLVTWKEGVEARELTSVSDILAAEEAGDVAIEAPGVVVNMPILVWPDGQR